MGVTFQNGSWKYQFQYQGKNYGERGFKTKKQAISAREDRKKEVKKYFKLTHESTDLLTSISLYLDEMERKQVDPKTYKFKRYVLKNFLEHTGNLLIATITENHIETYLRTRDNNSKYNKHRKEIRALFYFAMKKKLGVMVNPCLGIESMREENKRKIIPTIDEVTKILSVASRMKRAFIYVLIQTAARINEILKLEWKDVNFENRTITLYTRKTKDHSLEARTLIMNDELLEEMKELYERRTQDCFIFVNNRTERGFLYRPKMLKGLCKKAGVEPFGYHSLRRFAATQMVRNGVDIKSVQMILGHKSVLTTERYVYFVPEAIAEAMKKMGEIIPRNPPKSVSGERIGS